MRGVTYLLPTQFLLPTHIRAPQIPVNHIKVFIFFKKVPNSFFTLKYLFLNKFRVLELFFLFVTKGEKNCSSSWNILSEARRGFTSCFMGRWVTVDHLAFNKRAPKCAFWQVPPCPMAHWADFLTSHHGISKRFGEQKHLICCGAQNSHIRVSVLLNLMSRVRQKTSFYRNMIHVKWNSLTIIPCSWVPALVKTGWIYTFSHFRPGCAEIATLLCELRGTSAFTPW